MNLKMKQRKQTFRRSMTAFVIFLFSCCGIFAQTQTVTGTITDKNGEEIIGASVLVKGTSIGTITDIDGNFSVNAPASAKALVISYVGMKTLETTITGAPLQIVMNEDASITDLEEVVVIGYGTVKKKDLTGSVSSVKGDVIQSIPVTNVAEAITGKLAGVQITTTEGSPDAEMKITVRGGTSITQSNDPLYIVDGFPVESISDIPAADIESIDVLKDASSTAIYGSRGANGVILITTKSGKEGKINVNYSAYYASKKIAKTLDVLSPKDYALWQYELALLRSSKDDISSYTDYFGNYQDIDLYDNVPYNDWQDLTFGRTGNTFNHSLSLTGGSEQINFSFNYTHMNDKAIMQQSSFKRDNLSLKVNTKPAKNVTVDFSVRYSDTDMNGGGTNDTKSTLDTDKRLKYSVIYTPIPLSNLTSEAGSDDDDLGNLYNPLVALSDNARKQERKTLNMAGSFGWMVFDNFRIKTEFGLDNYDNSDKRYWGLTTYFIKNNPPAKDQGKPAIRLANTDRHKFRNTNTVNYDFKKWMGKEHSLNMMLGHEYFVTKSKVLRNDVYGFPESFSAEKAWILTSQGTPSAIEDFYNPDDILLSYFGRANYNYQSKYLLTATFRADGSSKFGEGNKWGYFPSAALAWRVSSESFMENTKDWLSDLKLRVSFGTAGNNNISSGQIVQSLSPYTTTWINGTNNYWAPTKDDSNKGTMSNPDLRWETTLTRNAGFDFTILNGKLNGTLDAYLNTTKDLLIQFPIGGAGYDYQYQNLGKTESRGLEATLNWTAINKKDYGLSFSTNISFNKTKIKTLGREDFYYESRWASSEIGNDYRIAVGASLGEMYGYRSDGRYEISDFERYDETTKRWVLKGGKTITSEVGIIRPGTMKIKNLDDNENITTEDREIIGNANPKHMGGFTINGRLHGFDLSAAFNWSYGNDVYNANKVEFTQTGKYDYRNMISIMESGSRWTNLRADGTLSNDMEELAAMNANTSMWSPYTAKMIFSDWAVEDGSFLRLNTLTLGYTLPKSIVSKINVQNLRFYASAYNVFCLTNYSGYDPEVSTIRSTNLTPGVDYSAYPRSRQFVVGLNLNF